MTPMKVIGRLASTASATRAYVWPLRSTRRQNRRHPPTGSRRAARRRAQWRILRHALVRTSSLHLITTAIAKGGRGAYLRRSRQRPTAKHADAPAMKPSLRGQTFFVGTETGQKSRLFSISRTTGLSPVEPAPPARKARKQGCRGEANTGPRDIARRCAIRDLAAARAQLNVLLIARKTGSLPHQLRKRPHPAPYKIPAACARNRRTGRQRE